MTYNERCCSILLALFAASVAGLDAQQTTATAAVTYEILEVNEISLSGDPEPLVVNRSVAGEAPSLAVDDRTTWTITTNGSDKKITALLDAAMPSGVTLAVTLAAPNGASSAAAVALSSTAQTLVSGLSSVSRDDLRVTYTLSASGQAGVVERDRRSITLTIVADS